MEQTDGSQRGGSGGGDTGSDEPKNIYASPMDTDNKQCGEGWEKAG